MALSSMKERHTLQTNPLLLPTVTSFIPGLPTGAAFRASIHCWQNPVFSRYIQNLKKPSDNVIFEARLFIDGRMAGSKWFNQTGPWPTVIELSIDLDKHGEFEKLKFPAFHKELLSQSYWDPGDDLGRIKVIIAEGFTREHLSYPFERVKNIVSFSFQHAPLDVLEASSIAWPNASMWRHVSLIGPYFTQASSPRGEAIEHGHSPRRAGTMLPPPIPTLFPRPLSNDPFTEPVHAAFRGWRQASSDVSMQDYSDPSTRTNSRNVSEPIVQPRDRTLESMPGYNALCEALMPSAPDNKPQNELTSPAQCPTVESEAVAILDPSDTQNAEKTTAPEAPLKSADLLHISPNTFSTTSSNSGTKRQRVVTPAASKAIDVEDEPRTSPSFRKTSLANPRQDGDAGDRKVLSTIENF